MSITCGVETLTPKDAAELRATNGKNRPLNEFTARGYASAMDRKEWRVNGEPIIVDESGALMDGQHRCRAVELHGKPVEMLVVRGVKSSSFDTIDIGKRRGIGDVLAIDGVENYSTVAAVATLAIRWETGNIGGSSNLTGRLRGVGVVTPTVVRKMLVRFPDIVSMVQRHIAESKDFPMWRRAVLAFLRWATNRVDAGKSENFWNGLIQGTDMKAGTARHSFLRFMTNNATSRTTLSSVVLLAYGIKAWNAHISGAKVGKFLVWRTTEAFPIISGFTPIGVQIK